MFLKELREFLNFSKKDIGKEERIDHAIDRTVLIVDMEDGCVDYYASLKDAKAAIEPPDAHQVRVYGTDGSIVQVIVDKPANTFWSGEDGVVRLVPTAEFDVDAVRLALLKHLRYVAQHPKFIHSLGQHSELQNDDISLNSLIDLLLTLE